MKETGSDLAVISLYTCAHTSLFFVLIKVHIILINNFTKTRNIKHSFKVLPWLL